MTSKLRKLAFAAFMSVTALSTVTLTSCSSDDEECGVGLSGKDCKTEIRTSYYNTYKGSGSDNLGGTYSDWSAKLSANGTDAKKLSLQLLDSKLASMNALTITLSTNTTFAVDSKVDGAFTYTGTGSISESAFSLSLTEVEAGSAPVTVIYTFNNMVKQ